MKPSPSISQFMTPSPIAIDARAAIREAHTLMSVNGFRHLPVVRDGETIGILSDRDLKLALGLNGIDLDTTRVEDIATFQLYAVGPDAPLEVVARSLAERKVGSVVVLQNDKLVGIFTTTDALFALCEVLQSTR